MNRWMGLIRFHKQAWGCLLHGQPFCFTAIANVYITAIANVCITAIADVYITAIAEEKLYKVIRFVCSSSRRLIRDSSYAIRFHFSDVANTIDKLIAIKRHTHLSSSVRCR